MSWTYKVVSVCTHRNYGDTAEWELTKLLAEGWEPVTVSLAYAEFEFRARKDDCGHETRRGWLEANNEAAVRTYLLRKDDAYALREEEG